MFLRGDFRNSVHYGQSAARLLNSFKVGGWLRSLTSHVIIDDSISSSMLAVGQMFRHLVSVSESDIYNQIRFLWLICSLNLGEDKRCVLPYKMAFLPLAKWSITNSQEISLALEQVPKRKLLLTKFLKLE